MPTDARTGGHVPLHDVLLGRVHRPVTYESCETCGAQYGEVHR